MKKYGIRIRKGTVITITADQYTRILPRIARGRGMITIGDRTVNIKDIAEISPIELLDREVLREQGYWRCSHGSIYGKFEKCTCSAYGTPVILGDQSLGLLDSDDVFRLEDRTVKELRGYDYLEISNQKIAPW
jgi:hypothetical protein